MKTRHKFLLGLIALFTAVFSASTAQASGLVVSSGSVTFVRGGSDVVIDANLTITGITDDIDSARVSIGNLQTGDSLIYTTINGVTGSYSAATGVLSLSGTTTAANYQAVLSSVKFSTTSTNTTSRTIDFALGSGLLFEGHFYEFVSGGLEWDVARAEAEALTLFGRQGYLVTITSAAENAFISSKTTGTGWIGARDINRNLSSGAFLSGGLPEGDWRWVTGPEGLEDSGNGYKFYSGYAIVGGDGAPYLSRYNGWPATGEPNNYKGSIYDPGEWVAHTAASGLWNDFAPSNLPSGYLVEYGGMEANPIPISGSKSVLVPPVLATVTTGSSSSLTATSVTISGNVSNDGAATVTARGIAWGTSANPTSGTSSGSGTGSFSVNLSSLSPNTTYYYRAYATNSVGTAYGTESSFTTPKLTQSITFATGAWQTKTYGDAAFSLTASASSELPVSFTSSNTAVASISGNTVTILAAGAVDITATQAGNDSYHAAPSVVRSLSITQRPLTGTFTVESPKTYNNTTTANVLTRSLSTLAYSDTQDANGVYLSGGATFDSKELGTGKTVTPSMSLAGTKAGNYSLLPMSTITADIVPDPGASITVGTSADFGWSESDGAIVAAMDGAHLNIETLRTRLLVGPVTVVAGRDIIFDANFAPALTARRVLNLRAGRDIYFNVGREIAPTGQALDMVVWSDRDASGGGMIWMQAASAINTNGGHLWMGGGSGSGTWNGLIIGDGFAIGGTPIETASEPGVTSLNGITIDTAATISTGAGIVSLRGESAASMATASYSLNVGVAFGAGAELLTTSGDVLVEGHSALTSRGSCTSGMCGYRYGILFHGDAVRDNRLETGSGNITLIGTAVAFSGTDSLNSAGIGLHQRSADRTVSIKSDSGVISITGENDATAVAAGLATHGLWIADNPTEIVSTSGAIYLYAYVGSDTIEGLRIDNDSSIGGGTTGYIYPTTNRMAALGGTASFSSNGGRLWIRTATSSTTIGIGGASGTLQLPASYFSNQFADGFEAIVIGNIHQSGAIAIGETVLRDPLALVTTSTVTQSGGAITGGQGLYLNGPGADNQLTNPGNSFSSLSAQTGSVALVNAGALSLIYSPESSSAISATGPVDIATLAGDLTLTANVTTTDPSADAIRLNAGRAEAPPTTSGGNLIIGGHTVTFGSGGTALLYTGEIAASTGLTGLAGYDAGRVYYASDEATTLSPAPGANLYVVTREKDTQAAVTLTLAASSIDYLTTTTITAAGGSGTGDYAIEVVSGDANVSVTGSSPTWTITGDASGTAQFRARRLNDANFLDSDWAQSDELTIAMVSPSITTPPTAGFLRAGQTLAASTLSGGIAEYLSANVAGSFDWTAPATTPAAGTPSVSVTFNPTDTDNFNPVTFNIAITVEAAPTQITLTAPEPATVAAGATSGNFTLTVRDGDDNPVPAIAAATFALTSNSASTGGAVDLPATVSLARGQSSVTFTYRDNLAGSHTIAASYSSGDSGLDGFSDSAGITVTPLSAAQLTLDPPAGTTEVNSATGNFTLTVRDPFGNPTTLASETKFSLETTSGSAYPNADFAGTNVIGGVIPADLTMAAGTTNATFTYFETAAGDWLVLARQVSGDSGLDGAQTSAPVTFTGATATGIALSAPGTSSTAGVASEAFTLTVVDSLGNEAAPLTEAASFTLASNSGSTGTAIAFSPTTVTVGAGSTHVTFTYMDQSAGDWEVTATYNSGLAALAGSNASAAHTVTAAAANRIAFVNPPAGANVGTATTVSVQVQDAFGNPSTVHSGYSDVISVSQGTLNPDSVDIAASASGLNFSWTPASAGTATLTASASGLSGASHNVSVILVQSPALSSTLAPTAIRPTMAVSGGNVSSDSGAAVLVRGVVWSSTELNPTLGANDGYSRDGGAGTGSFYSTIDGLTPGTTYNVRAYATNALGTGYGPTQTFTTPAEIPEGPAVSYFTIEGVTLTVTAQRSGYHANAYSFTLTPAEEPAGAPVRVVKSGDAYAVYARAGAATHQHVASALAADPYIASATISHGSSALLALPQVQLASAGVQAAFYQTAAAPVAGTGGTFRIADYGTNSSIGNYWYRGYIFNVSQSTQVTHLVSAVSGGSATVVLYRAAWNGAKVRGAELLGYVSGVTGTGSEVVTQLRLPNGSLGSVTLSPGTQYLLAQTAIGGSHVYVSNLRVADLEGHPRIASGSWQPTTNSSIRWDNSGDQNFLLNRDHYDYNGAMPRIGFHFSSTVDFPQMQTQQGSLTGNQLTFNAVLQRTNSALANAGQPTSLFIEYHTTPTVTSGVLAAATPGTTTSDNTAFSHTINMVSGQVYYYRGVAINERGRANSDLWRVGQTSSGDFRFDAGTVIRVTGDNTRIGTQVRFNGSAASVGTTWNATGSGTLTVNYVGGATTFDQIRTAINNSGYGLQAVLLSGSGGGIPERADAAMAEGYLQLTITAENLTKTVDQAVVFNSASGFMVDGLDNPSGLPVHAVDAVTFSSTAAGAVSETVRGVYPISVSAAQGTGLDNYAIQYVDGNMTVLPGPPASIAIVQQPANAVAGVLVPGLAAAAPSVRVFDAWDNPVLSGIAVTTSVSKSAFASGSTLTATTDTDGYATFDNLTLEAADTDYELTFAVDEPGAL